LEHKKQLAIVVDKEEREEGLLSEMRSVTLDVIGVVGAGM